MERRRRNATALGLLVLVAGVVCLWGFYFLMGDPVWRRGTDVFAVLEDGAGLKRGDPVVLQGVEIGQVRRVQLAAPRNVVVSLRLNDGIVVPADSRVTVRADVFGANTVALLPGVALVRLEAGDTLRGEAAPALPVLVEELGGQAQSLLAKADSLLAPRAVADLHATAAILPESMAALRAAFQELSLAAGALRRSAEELQDAEAGAAMARAIAELEGSARAIGQAAGAMERSLNSLSSILNKVDQGEGTLGLLVNDTTVYAELARTLREMRALATDVRERPGRYVNISVF